MTVRFEDSMSPASCIACLVLGLNFAADYGAFRFCIVLLGFWDTTARRRWLGDGPPSPEKGMGAEG
jgi:hypothetical protein